MATPIKDTPVLTGEDARKFEESLRNPKPVSREDVERARREFDSVQVVDLIMELTKERDAALSRLARGLKLLEQSAKATREHDHWKLFDDAVAALTGIDDAVVEKGVQK